MDPHAGSTVLHYEAPVPACKFRAKHIRIGNIILDHGAGIVQRTDKEMPSLSLIQETSEEETAVKPGQTHPFDICPLIDIGQVRAIPDDAHLILVRPHDFLLSI
jgi:hypothetical protein